MTATPVPPATSTPAPGTSPAGGTGGMPYMPGGSGTAPSPCPTPSGIVISIPQGATGKGPAAYGDNPKMITAGDTVTWINDDTVPHTVTANDNSYDSGPLQHCQTFSHTFTDPGNYPYYCSIHGQQSMSGTIQAQ